MEALIMDNHLWFGVCFLHDAGDRAQYVSDCGKVEKTNAQDVWWQVGLVPWHSPLTVLFMPLMVVTMIVYRFDKVRRQRKLSNKRVNEAFIGSWF
ncbi:hypothetical protein [Paraflavitalea speifideaquila]|uniref:hypothetical protein n=1 Tax=Paraflavitalea speifideaquila TaxID=3076558 RepID=UPI0028F02586|nr:hypothetical protein [Paraflavitalea speifideiaquila]